MKKRRTQTTIKLSQWGGKRLNAGRRPRGKRAGVAHRSRERVTQHTPVHVTLKLASDLGDLRRAVRFEAIYQSFIEARDRNDVRLTQFSVQRDHIHLIVEAESRVALSRGIQGLNIRIARAINRAMGRKGRVFVDRFDATVLRAPQETRDCLCAVLNHARQHSARQRRPADWIDPCASGAWFDGYRGARGRRPAWAKDPAPVAEPRSWLLEIGWRKYGLLEPSEIPAQLD